MVLFIQEFNQKQFQTRSLRLFACKNLFPKRRATGINTYKTRECVLNRGFQQMNNIGNNDNIDNIAICVFAHICSFLLNSDHIVLVNANYISLGTEGLYFKQGNFGGLLNFRWHS